MHRHLRTLHRASRLALPAFVPAPLPLRPRPPRACSSSSSSSSVAVTAAPPRSQRDNTLAPVTIVDERPLYQGYRKVFARRVRFPASAQKGDAREITFDVLGDPSVRPVPTSVFVFPVEAETGRVTIVREYQPGPHALLPGFVAGFVEPDRHASPEEAALMELSEEASLVAGKLIPLTEPDNGAIQGIFRDKYAVDKFMMYMAIDCREDPTPRNLDDGEHLSYERGVSFDKVRQMIFQGQMNTPSALLGMLALDRLRAMGLCS